MIPGVHATISTVVPPAEAQSSFCVPPAEAQSFFVDNTPTTLGLQTDVKPPKLDAMLMAGVRTFLDLTEDGELLPYVSELPVRASVLGVDLEEIQYHRFAIRDRSLPDSVEYMHSIMRVLEENERKGRISAVHCRGGIGRTGTVIGCYLVASGRAKDGAHALEIIAREWAKVAKSQVYRHSPETGPQFEFVLNFHPEKASREQLAF
ncbi:protein-tyrosine phosphatase-like protein [Roridomyces roridus]|uniref:Protein-tyrosine phosphatase-like protein n=1 Tax=Roridomyces roridus TaxID=1738132 RepID=A0AAD7BK14_9AGAR|nr:protein-tyrosine phosphatase-like protein [Roridomyces roridus]